MTSPKILKELWSKFTQWIKTKWIGSPYFVFFMADFLLSNAHYLRKGVWVTVTDETYNGYRMEGGDVEMWVWDYSCYVRVALWALFSILLGLVGYKASKKELAGAIIYTVIAFKDCRDFYVNHNVGTILVDYTILFVSLTIVHFYFSKKKGLK